MTGACDPSAGGPTPDGDAERGGLGKADLVGSCAPNGNSGDHCGAKSNGTCWCDDLCVQYGDCCSDVDEVCGIEPPDDGGGDPTFCGGFLGSTCSDEEYCAYQPGQYCGAADASSTCEPRPEACIELFAPVCGCDGNTYGNSCFAAMAGTGVLSQGECPPPPPGQFCGGFGGFPCPVGQVCVDDPNDDCDPANGGADCGGICELEPDEPPPPAGGCTDACGGQASDGCWCDSYCSAYGDCCDDYTTHCE